LICWLNKLAGKDAYLCWLAMIYGYVVWVTFMDTLQGYAGNGGSLFLLHMLAGYAVSAVWIRWLD